MKLANVIAFAGAVVQILPGPATVFVVPSTRSVSFGSMAGMAAVAPDR
jgi:threonine/homoserine/homoserine lactone efflux protein